MKVAPKTLRDRRDRLQLAECEIDEAQSAYLRAFGWKRSSTTPGSLRVWIREFPGFGQYTANVDTAIRLTRATLEDERNLDRVGLER